MSLPITDPRYRFWHSKQWKRTKDQVLARDGHRCTGHGPHRGRLSVHHVQSLRNAWHLRLSFDNLVTLCSGCHGRIEAQRRANEVHGGAIMGTSPGAHSRQRRLFAKPNAANRFKGSVI